MGDIMTKCLVCKRELEDYELDYCATRQTDGGKVCPTCTQKIKNGHVPSLQKYQDSARLAVK